MAITGKGVHHVTRVTTSTASAASWRVAPLLAALLAATLLAGCSTSEQTTQAPAELASPQTTKKAASVSLAPVAAPGSVSKKMSSMLATAAKEKNIPVKNDGADYTVRGYLVASPESEGTKVSFIWDVTDKSGKRAHRFSGEEMVDKRVSGDPWAAVDDKAMRKIALTTADRLKGWLPKKDAPAQVATTGSVSSTSSTGQPSEQRSQLASAAARPSELLVAVPEVRGAPGQGNTELPEAMRRQLKSRGMKLVSAGNANAYTVRGRVELGDVEDGKQPITIRWRVLDPNGNQMKSEVVQRNKIGAGSLDGSWGRVSDIAAGEAVKAITKILPDTTS